MAAHFQKLVRRGAISTAILATAILTMATRLGLAAPTVDQALKLAPVQHDVDYDRPTADEAAHCTIKAEKVGGQTGWVIRDANGQILRQFVDTNGDNVVDRWCYFKDGIEVYRDIDENYKGKATQHRWMNTAGTRWGLDRGADGKIESWKMISAEEATYEVVMALREKDEARFERLLLTSSELKSLGLGAEKTREIEARLNTAPARFKEMLGKQRVVTGKTTWQYFGATRPGIVPAGTGDSTADLLVYENVMAMIETGGEHAQLQIGALVKVGDLWRVVDAPQLPDAHGKLEAVANIFFPTAKPMLPDQPATATASATGGLDPKVQELLTKLEKLDTQANNASPEKAARLNEERATLLQDLADQDEKGRGDWLRQLADTVSAAVQSGNYPDGVARLKTLSAKLDKESDANLAAHVKLAYLAADYNQSLQAKDASFVDVQKAWLTNLEQFAKDYPKTPDTAEALLQLGIAEEFAGQEEKAKHWYGQIAADFKDASSYKKATGAVTRLESVGRPIALRGAGLRNENIDLAKLRGKVVLIQYWATWCEPAKADMAQIKELKAKYGKNFEVIGVNLDTDKATVVGYLQKNPLPWPQLWEAGGLDSRYANELGILTLPSMLLIDARGNVANRSIHSTELDSELKAQIK